MNLLIIIVLLSLAFVFFFINSKKREKVRIANEIEQRRVQNQNIEDYEVAEVMRIVDQSIEIVNKSKNFDTRISRVDVAIDKLNYLNRRFPHREDIEKALNDTEAYRPYLHTAIIEDKVEKLIDRSRLAKTLAGKVTSANKALEVLKEATANKYVDQKKVKYSVVLIKKYIHSEELKDIETKAERFEFKENYKKALDRYQDALFFMHKDEIDDNLQKKDIERFEGKIKMLKRKIAAPKLKK